MCTGVCITHERTLSGIGEVIMAKKESKKPEWKGETEDERIDSMLIYTTLNNIKTRFGANMIPVELNILDLMMAERLKQPEPADEPDEK